MKYYELKIYTDKPGLELISNLLVENEIEGAVVNDPQDYADIMAQKDEFGWDYADEEKLKPESMRPSITVYFEDSYKMKRRMGFFREALVDLQNRAIKGEFGPDIELGRITVETRIVNDVDWKDEWKKYFKPSHITDKIVVKPGWEEYEPKAGEKVIELNPGMAFGTGTHETTSSCIKLMEKYMTGDDKIGDAADLAVLDAGCGSGILSIVAGLLGSRNVLGVDIDKTAVEVSIENVEKNGLSDVVEIAKGDISKGIDFKADIIVANITIDLIELLTKDVRKHLSKGGIYISSGILQEQKDRAFAVLTECGFEIDSVIDAGEWCAIAAKVK